MQKTKLISRVYTPKEEFGRVKYTLNKLDWFIKNGYQEYLTFPNNPDLKKPFSIQKEKEMFKLLLQEYDESFYKKGLLETEKAIKLIKPAIEELTNLPIKWNFKTFSTVEILLTRYGVGGSYDYGKGKIIIKTDKEATFNGFKVENTIVDEIFHIGIEESIVLKYNLSQAEKESLVDRCLILLLKENILPNYSNENFVVKEINSAIKTKEDIYNLPKVIESYISKYPR